MYEKNDDKTSYSLIENMFGDYRKIVGRAPSEVQNIARVHNISATIYMTEDDELISFSLTMDDIGNAEMEKLKKYGEELYELNGKLVCIYILGSTHSKFKATTEIESEAPLLINVSIMKYSSTYDTLRHIESLGENRKKLDREDLFALKMIPSMGPPEDRRNLRIECLKLWKTIIKKGLIK